jgi:transposase
MTARYLGQAAVARELGVSRHLVGTWRNRYKDTGTPFPEPDAIVDESDGRDVPGWLPESMDAIRAWRASLPGQGAGGGRPRKADEPARETGQ